MKHVGQWQFIFCLFIFFSNARFESQAQTGLWTWVHGDSINTNPAHFSYRGIPDSSNVPPGMYAPVFWTDMNGNFWLYGGKNISGYYYSDMWMFDPDTRMWTWMQGDSGLVNQFPRFGLKGVASAANSPGCRGLGSPAWTDTSGNLWMYSGYTKKRTGSPQFWHLSDLWKYDTQSNEWTWMDGDSIPTSRVQGTKGVPSPLNSPGYLAENSDHWVDRDNNFWFYGGGIDFSADFLLWRYNPQSGDWTWMSGGANFGNPVYGTKGIFDTLSYPGARFAHTSWQGNDGKYWLFGGSPEGLVYDQFRNDLWSYDPQINQWAWFAGDDSLSDIAHFGANCQPGDTMTPGNGIEGRAAWVDSEGNLWKYGGKYEVPGAATTANQSMLWCFVMDQKKWMLVNSPVPDPQYSMNVARRFGVLGQPDINSHPGARCGTASFKDRNGVFYVFGGLYRVPVSGNELTLNEMWSYEPDPACLLLAEVGESMEADKDLSVFPNPTLNTVHISQNDGQIFNSVTLMDLQGKLIQSSRIDRQTDLELKMLVPGIYLMVFNSDLERRVVKLIIQ